MKVWMADNYTEAHRTWERQLELVKAFRQVGVTIVPTYESGIDLAFCGSLFSAPRMRRKLQVVDPPTVYYNWDLYPHVVNNHHEMGWSEYLKDLRRCDIVVVPNEGTRLRTQQLVDRESIIVHAPVRTWDVPPKPKGTHMAPRSYVLDVMRDYSWDVGYVLPQHACQKIGMPLVRTKTRTDWDTFRWLVANARCLISAVCEASTGGLTLLEGYHHGVPVVVSGSSLNGAGEYFGPRAHYFEPGDNAVDSLASQLAFVSDRHDDGAWVQRTYSDFIFARELKEVFARCLTTN